MPAEHKMFELVMQGMSVEDILKLPKETEEESPDDFEMF